MRGYEIFKGYSTRVVYDTERGTFESVPAPHPFVGRFEALAETAADHKLDCIVGGAEAEGLPLCTRRSSPSRVRSTGAADQSKT